MFSLSVIIFIVIAHFVGDFLLQSDMIALNKRKDSIILIEHSLLYTLPFLGIFYFLSIHPVWLIINTLLHFIVDFYSSRLTSKLFEQKRHWFFVTIGASQAIHLIMLFSTLMLFISFIRK